MTTDYVHEEPFWNPQIKAATGFTVAYLLAAVIGAITTGNGEFVIYIGVMVFVFAILGYVHHRVRLNTAVIWALSGWGALHMAGGLIPVPETWPIDGDIRVLYSWWLIPDLVKYDHIVHSYGFGVTTWVCWQGLVFGYKKAGVTLQPTFGMLTLCWVAGMGFGALNEVIEFAATLMVAETNVGGYVNTGWDLVANLLGALVAVLAIWQCGKRKSDAEPE